MAVRDRYGIRPLYVLEHRGKQYFASEIKAFDVISDFKRSFHINNLCQHCLLWNTLNDSTVYENIRSLPAGTFEIYQPGHPPQSRRYYEIGETDGSSPPNIDSVVEEFSCLLDNSVRLRLRSDVAVGTYLSGGIDSSIITYLTRKYHNDNLKTFSVSFKDKKFVSYSNLRVKKYVQK